MSKDKGFEPRQFVRMFQPRFAELVESKVKRQTIRKMPVRMPRIGDILSAREWTGKPYRSKQRELLRTPFVGIYGVHLNSVSLSMFNLAGEHPRAISFCQSRSSRDCFARWDGFESWADLVEWFETIHALPFEGILHTW